MATLNVPVPANTWTLVSTVSVGFQITEQHDAYASESVAAPSPDDLTAPRVYITPRKKYTFQKVDGDLYMFSKDADINISIEPTV